MSLFKSVVVPGPGSYQMPSEFGHYENKKKYILNNDFYATTNTFARASSQPQL
jgi:hypothetical protein